MNQQKRRSSRGEQLGMSKHFEDLVVGWVVDHRITRTVTEADNILFSSLTMNPQPLHIDAHFAASTEFGRPLINSFFTLGLMVGISVYDTTLGTTVANLGMTDVAFPAPLFQGDTIRVRTTVASRRDSKSRADAGIVEFVHEAFNQDALLVARCTRAALMLRRPNDILG